MKDLLKTMSKEIVTYFGELLKEEYLDLVYENRSDAEIKETLIESIQVAMPDYNGCNKDVLKNLTTEYDDSDEMIDFIVETWLNEDFQDNVINEIKKL
jgi:hypothetical protein